MNCDSGRPREEPPRKEIIYEWRFEERLRQPQSNALAQRNNTRMAISRRYSKLFVNNSCTRSPKKPDDLRIAADARILYTFSDLNMFVLILFKSPMIKRPQRNSYDNRFADRLPKPQSNTLTQRNNTRIAISKHFSTRSAKQTDDLKITADAGILYTFGEFNVFM